MAPSPEADRSLLAGPVDRVAPALLGWIVRRGDVAVRLTEVEAYGGADDAGSHAARGRTARNATMFGPAGRLYCYLSYGMHVCANVVTGPADVPGAVLLRAGEVVDGLDLARSRRPGATDRDLARGPARLCRALGVGLGDDGTSLDQGPVRLLRAPAPDEVCSGPRVGLTREPDRPWRWWEAGAATVSAYRRSPRALPRGGSPRGPGDGGGARRGNPGDPVA